MIDYSAIMIMGSFVFGMLFGRLIEAQFWKTDCLLRKVKKGKYVDYVLSFKAKS